MEHISGAGPRCRHIRCTRNYDSALVELCVSIELVNDDVALARRSSASRLSSHHDRWADGAGDSGGEGPQDRFCVVKIKTGPR